MAGRVGLTAAGETEWAMGAVKQPQYDAKAGRLDTFARIFH